MSRRAVFIWGYLALMKTSRKRRMNSLGTFFHTIRSIIAHKNSQKCEAYYCHQIFHVLNLNPVS